MDHRRLRLLLLAAVLLPVPAQADRHTVECFGGVSPEKQQALAARTSCGLRVQSTPAVRELLGRFLGGPAAGTGRLHAGQDPGHHAATTARGPKPTKGSLFVVGEAAEYVAGRDSGKDLDGWMVGGRYLFIGQKPVEPFLHVLVGRQRPSRSDAVAADAVSGQADTLSVGGGVDLEINPSLHTGIVPVLRLQFDVVTPKEADAYGRVTFGVSFRFEGSDH